MATFISHSPEETFSLGERWGRLAQPGWIFALQGDLGAGKTQLVKGIAHGLGIATRIVSPTFALMHHYDTGRVPLTHIDLYRLDTRIDVINAGLEDALFSRDSITVLEWPERWTSGDSHFTVPPAWRWVKLTQIDELTRSISHEGIEP
jgi:tRNA threonylcarbamoyladenosine biosynthesis protein TsaE